MENSYDEECFKKCVETGKVIRSCDDCVRDAVKFLEDALKSEN